MRGWGLLIAIVMALAGVAVPTTPPSMRWATCAGTDVPPGMDCATVEVPVDWAKPDGRKLSLNVARLPSTDPAARIGTVFSIPGGPGAPGIADLERAPDTFTGLRQRFDVVSFDPRNLRTGLPAPCQQPGQIQILPANEAEHDAQAAANRAAMIRCREADPELLDHVDSASVARDIEAVREALGEKQLSLVANSYGGVPAAAYARLFPDRVRAVVMDSVGNHVVPMAESDRLGYQGREDVFARFAAWCATDPACALRGEDVPGVWRAQVAAADRTPIPATGSDVAYSGIDLKVNSTLLLAVQARWPEFALAIDGARHGDAAGFARVSPMPKQPLFPLSTVHCEDGFRTASYAEYATLRGQGVRWSPNFAGLADVFHSNCAGSPAPLVNPPAPLPVTELPPFLGVASWGEVHSVEGLVSAVPGSTTIRYDGTGHMLYQAGSRCVIDQVDRYLIDPTAPLADTTCPADVPPTR